MAKQTSLREQPRAAEMEFVESFRIEFPATRQASGLYEHSVRTEPSRTIPIRPQPQSEASGAEERNGTASATPIHLLFNREELRLDVDGRYPQMVASGTLYRRLEARVHWIANLTTAHGPRHWIGNIWYKDGDVASLPYTEVDIKTAPGSSPNTQSAVVQFSGGGANQRTTVYRFRSPSFHQVDIEFDYAEGTTPVVNINTGAHPNRPATLPVETLTAQKVFQRAGFTVSTSTGSGSVPLVGAGPNAKWSDQEMHDAMQTYWSHFANQAQWAFWTFFASLSEQGTSLGGIMFDDIGPQHRQGTAIFEDAFISQPPAGDPDPVDWVSRMRFWTACHEMGHTFNLAHSWQKGLTSGGKGPWIPLANEPEARSFMNYPYNVNGGQTAFFADFEFRFTDSELLFLRHAPGRFVEMGNAEWFDHHGFRQAEVSAEPPLRLELRANRDKPAFEFLEPVTLELKLTNISQQPLVVPVNILTTPEQMTIVIKQEGKPARQFAPYAHYCRQLLSRPLLPGNENSMYESLFVAAGVNGWHLAEPGNYIVQVALEFNGEDVVSNPLFLRIAPPEAKAEEFLAQDFFSDDVGRLLTFDGSRYLEVGNNTLREVADRLKDRKVAVHARVALANSLMRSYKQLEVAEGIRTTTSLAHAGAKIVQRRPDPKVASDQLTTALVTKRTTAAESLGHIDYKYYVDRFTDWLAEQGEGHNAVNIQREATATLAQRGVIERVLREGKERADRYEGKARPMKAAG